MEWPSFLKQAVSLAFLESEKDWSWFSPANFDPFQPLQKSLWPFLQGKGPKEMGVEQGRDKAFLFFQEREGKQNINKAEKEDRQPVKP